MHNKNELFLNFNFLLELHSSCFYVLIQDPNTLPSRGICKCDCKKKQPKSNPRTPHFSYHTPPNALHTISRLLLWFIRFLPHCLEPLFCTRTLVQTKHHLKPKKKAVGRGDPPRNGAETVLWGRSTWGNHVFPWAPTPITESRCLVYMTGEKWSSWIRLSVTWPVALQAQFPAEFKFEAVIVSKRRLRGHVEFTKSFPCRDHNIMEGEGMA